MEKTEVMDGEAEAAGDSRLSQREAFRAWASGDGAIDEFCEHIAQGVSFLQLTKDYGFVYSTVRYWIAADAERTAKYARAREDRADKYADEIVAISDELDVVTIVDGKEVKLALDPVAVARNRLRVDARKWVAAKLKPRSYGDRTIVAGDPDAPLVTHTYAMTDEQLLAIAAAAGGSGG